MMKTRSPSRSQGRKGDRPSGGRLCDIHEPTNRNLIRGRSGMASWHNTAKPFISTRQVNQAVVWRRSASLSGEICPTGRPAFGWGAPGSVMGRVNGQKSAEAIVVATSRGLRDARVNCETATLVKAKGRTSPADRPSHPSAAMNPTFKEGEPARIWELGRERASAWRHHPKRLSGRGRWGRHSNPGKLGPGYQNLE